MSKIIYGENNQPNVSAALESLRVAYERNDEEKIANALEAAQATIKEFNRLSRKNFYLAQLNAANNDSVIAKANICKAGYIEQIKLVNRYNPKTKTRNISTDKSEAQIDVLEVNALVRKDLFSDFILSLARPLRDALAAYTLDLLEKTSKEIEDNVGYSSLKYLASEKTSIGGMQKLFQSLVDEICFLDNGKGKNSILIKKSDVHAMLTWVGTHMTHYGTKFATAETTLSYVLDIIYGNLNGINMTIKLDDKEF